MEILIISGLSGAGKSRVAAVLEDLDFYCVDNMPVELIAKFAELVSAARGRYERVALVTDARAITNPDELFTALDALAEIGVTVRILFVEADVPTIVKRYKETRRRHPLDQNGTDLIEAVRREIELLAPLRLRADDIINTTSLPLSKFQRIISGLYNSKNADGEIGITIKSFGFKHGLPIEADLVFDVRFLPNPHYIPHLREKTGLDEEVYDYVHSFDDTRIFMQKLNELIEFLLPRYIAEGKRSLFICIGCTGGRHRSVSVARALREHLQSTGHPADCVHRDAMQ